MNKRITLLLLSIIVVGNIYAQSAKVDSLENILKFHKTEDTVRVNLLNKIAYYVYKDDSVRTGSYAIQAGELADKLGFLEGKVESIRLVGLTYYKSDKLKAIEYFQKALRNAEEIKYTQGITRCLNNLGICYKQLGDNSKAIECYQKGIKIFEALGNKIETANWLQSLAMIDRAIGNYDEAIAGLNKVLKISEELGEKSDVANTLNTLGVIYAYRANYPLALDHFQRAMKIKEELNDGSFVFTGLINVGNIYLSLSDYPNALEHFKKAQKMAEAQKNSKWLANALANVGYTYLQTNDSQALEYFQKSLIANDGKDKLVVINLQIYSGDYYLQRSDYKEAMAYYTKAIKLAEELGKQRSVCEVLSKIGSVYMKQKEYPTALDYTQKSLAIAVDLKLLDAQKDIRNQLSEIYAATNDYKNAFANYKRYKELKDSIFNESNIKKITGLEYTYKFEKEKQAIELEQQKKDVIQVAEKKQQGIIMFSFIGAFLLVSLLSIFVYRSYRIKRQSNILLTQQKQEIEAKNEDLVQLNEEISAQREEISSQRDEIEAQRDLVVLQKDHIQAQKEKITDSIDYAQHIQQALLPSTAYATANLGEHFILFKPKDVVSGDFYWCTRINEYLIVTVADCTGHGVPGAFMSMLGISFLNEIVGKRGVVRASEILDELRKSVVDALQQKWQTGEQKDGMDMALIVINTQTAQLQYAGAQNPLYMVTAGNELRAIKGDNQTVAINNEMKPFTNHEIALSKGDCIYLATDGYHDQFGGPANKKFKGKQLKDLFVSISEKPMAEQREILHNALESWRGSGEQIDDVTILGMRV